jgi:hypothetical protein
MTLETLSSYAEVFGGIAVIFSLIYLAFQVGANTREQRHRARYDQFEIQNSIYDLMIEDPETTIVFLKAGEDYESLSNEERLRFGAANLKALHAFYLIMEMRDDGLIDDDVFRGFEQFILGSLSTPGSRYWWENMQFPKHVAPRVQAHFNRLLAEQDRAERHGRRK